MPTPSFTSSARVPSWGHPATNCSGGSTIRLCIDRIARSPIQILTPSLSTPIDAPLISRQTGLFINDALVVAPMQHHGLTKLASHDADFDRVPGLTRYAPV